MRLLLKRALYPKTIEFRRSVADCCTKPYHDDHYLLRWLRARNFNPEAAEKMLREGAAILANSGRRDLDSRTSRKVQLYERLNSRSLTVASCGTAGWLLRHADQDVRTPRKSMKWREKWEVETLNTWEPPEVIKKYYPSGLAGFDKEGAPVVVIPFAGLDMWGMLHSLNKTDFIRMTIKMIETYQGIAWEQSKTCGQAAGTVSAIIDMENFNLRQYAWRPAPKIFAIAFSVVKNFLNEYTLSKIKIFKNDPRKYQPLLLQIIDDNQLPKHYGGTMTDPDGDPTCPSKIHPGGKVPKSFYLKNADDKGSSLTTDNLCTIVVKKGEKLKLPYIVAQEGSFLKWEFKTEGHDIKFGVLCKNADEKDTVVIPIHRVTSHTVDEVGVITCPEPATYMVVFDNSYSYLRNKKLHYSIQVTPPIKMSMFSDEEVVVKDI
uniref:SEC14-like protein 2 n=1 Tax=Timema monikensis TaxID=170555 RepID=A0A7R9EB04_9NEOP|nr:unnamed protein product [Timema monikensis]